MCRGDLRLDGDVLKGGADWDGSFRYEATRPFPNDQRHPLPSSYPQGRQKHAARVQQFPARPSAVSPKYPRPGLPILAGPRTALNWLFAVPTPRKPNVAVRGHRRRDPNRDIHPRDRRHDRADRSRHNRGATLFVTPRRTLAARGAARWRTLASTTRLPNCRALRLSLRSDRRARSDDEASFGTPYNGSFPMVRQANVLAYDFVLIRFCIRGSLRIDSTRPVRTALRSFWIKS